jgi:hypothetical protein
VVTMRGTAAGGGTGNDESIERGLAGTRVDLRERTERLGQHGGHGIRDSRARVGRCCTAAQRSSGRVVGSALELSRVRARGSWAASTERESVQARRPTQRPKQGPTASQKQGKGNGWAGKANQQRGAGAYLEPAALDGAGSGLLAA